MCSCIASITLCFERLFDVNKLWLDLLEVLRGIIQYAFTRRGLKLTVQLGKFARAVARAAGFQGMGQPEHFLHVLLLNGLAQSGHKLSSVLQEVIDRFG